MNYKKADRNSISRRGFLKGSALAVGSGLIAGTELNAAERQTEQNPATVSRYRVPGYCGEGDWLGEPPVIQDTKIKKIINTEVLVLGGGHAGVLAALAASDMGVKVSVIEKMDEAGFAEDTAHFLGEDIGHVNSKWLISRGYGPYDTGEITAEFIKRAAGRCNPDIIRLFVENSGAMFDRMVEVYQGYEAERKASDSRVKLKYSDGVTETYDLSNVMDEKFLYNQVQKDRSPKDYPIEIGGFKTWPCVAMFQGPLLRRAVGPFVSVLRLFEKYTVKKAMDNGANWYYRHKAVVLTQDKAGAVTGAIVQDKDGAYIRFNASSVIVTTGAFSGNADMCWALLNEMMELADRLGLKKEQFRLTTSSVRDGHGHKMCCWAGGMIESSPRGGMINQGGATGPWGIGPMLQLNAQARRFTNEAAIALVAYTALRQPPGIMCLVTDRKYMKSIVIAGVEHTGPNFGRPEWLEDMQEDMAKVVAAGAKGYSVRGLMVAEREGAIVFGANTLEELAGYLGYKGSAVNIFVESIKRYNALCYKGVDSDFGKDAKAMIPIDEPPFYGCNGMDLSAVMSGYTTTSGVFSFGLFTTAGLVTDASLRVLNKAGEPIKGLFVAGNTLGGRYGLGYTTPFAGNSIGMAMTHGWMAGKFAAGA
jgi:hypothetical protein